MIPHIQDTEFRDIPSEVRHEVYSANKSCKNCAHNGDEKTCGTCLRVTTGGLNFPSWLPLDREAELHKYLKKCHVGRKADRINNLKMAIILSSKVCISIEQALVALMEIYKRVWDYDPLVGELCPTEW